MADNVITLVKDKSDKETESEDSLEEVMKKNKENKERLAKDRAKHNKKTFREYRITPKGE